VNHVQWQDLIIIYRQNHILVILVLKMNQNVNTVLVKRVGVLAVKCLVEIAVKNMVLVSVVN